MVSFKYHKERKLHTMKTLCLLLFIICGVVSHGEESDEEDDKRSMILHSLQPMGPRTVLLDGYRLVTRQISTNVFRFRSYRTVSVIFYPIMRDVIEARFLFQSDEVHLNNIGSCTPQEVIVNLKHGSYPAVNPDGYDFPKNYISPKARETIHTIEMKSDGNNVTYTLKNPKPGNWFALVYVKWEDPQIQKVEQQGLVAACHTVLYTDLQVKQDEEILLINCYSSVTVDYLKLPVKLKCMSRDTIDSISFKLIVSHVHVNSSKILFRVNAQSMPTDDNFLISCVFDPKVSRSQYLDFEAHPNSWLYMTVDYTNHNTSAYAECESYTLIDGTLEENHTLYELMRDDKGRFFTYDYGLPTAELQDVTSLINITSHELKTVRFEVNEIIDVGGSLIIESSLLMSLKYYMGYKRQLKKGALLAFTKDSPYMRVVICATVNYISTPLLTGHCKFNDHVQPALFVLNITDSESIYDKIIIPYPESGTWYVTLRLFCDDIVCPCPTSHNGTKYYVQSNLTEQEEADVSAEITNTTHPGKKTCNATVVLSITSSVCNAGHCSNHGSCLLNTFGGFLMSYCHCPNGYGAWDCSDDSRMDSRGEMLMSVLLLTLSNLLFLLSIYIAIIRYYYKEAMIYTFTMVFSTFYHACDAPAAVAYCVVKGNILQFGDFYSGLMSFWVTLVAMAIISDAFRSSLQLFGAICIALLTTWNMHSIMSFLLPVIVGVVVLFLSWLIDYRRNRKLLYSKSYYKIHLPIGLVFVSVGLICYAFLQTEQNYKIVHSFWHMIIALSVLFLLPDSKRMNMNPFVPNKEYFKIRFPSLRNRSNNTPQAQLPTNN